VSEVSAGGRSKAAVRVKARLVKMLQNPRTAYRAKRLASVQSHAALRAFTTAQRFEGFVNEYSRGDELGINPEHRRQLLSYYTHLRQHIPTLPLQPVISVVVPVYRPDPGYLREALVSVALQTYPHWEVCIVDDASADPEVTAVIAEFAAEHPDQVKVVVNDTNLHISGASNAGLQVATGEYVTLLDHDDRLYPHALAEVVRSINSTLAATGTAPQILYSDEKVIGPDGEHLHDSFNKPGWSPFLHMSVNYTTHLSVYSRELLDRIDGFRVGFEGAQDHDLMLRAVAAADTDVVHIPILLYQWRSHPQSTAGTGDAKPYAWDAGMRAVAEICEQMGRPVTVTMDESTGHYRLAFDLPDPRPRVSLVIPSKDSTEYLGMCINSVRRESTYPDIEIVVVDNGSTLDEVLDFYRELERTDPDIKIVSDPGYFNFARLNNVGAAAATGEYLVLLNNDTEVVTPDWVEQMLMYAQFPEIGAVGARLLYPDGSIQHGGIVGIGAHIADHTGWHSRPEDRMYLDMVNTVHEALAVTAAAMMIRASTFSELGGFHESVVPNGFGDVDLCLRLRAAGLTNIYTPYATLIHHESITRKRNIEVAEIQYMRSNWGMELLNDPYLNPNLNRSGQYTPDLNITQPDIEAVLFADWLAKGKIG
jgi:O-antigen biosynthesis protein